MLLSSRMKGGITVDIRTRVLTARLALRVDGDKAYSEVIRTKNTSHYRKGTTKRRGIKC